MVCAVSSILVMAILMLGTPDSNASSVSHRSSLAPNATSYASPIATAGTTPTPPPDVTEVCFQNGVSGYTGVADTFISRDNADTPRGSDSRLHVSHNAGVASLLSFDLTSIPSDATIRSATLSLSGYTRTGDHPISLQANQVYAAWNEAEATWNRARSGDWWGDPGCNHESDRSFTPTDEIELDQVSLWVSFDLTPLVQLWVNDHSHNQGLGLRGEGEQQTLYTFWSSNAPTASSGPRLCVEYVLPDDSEGQISGIVWHDRNSNKKRDPGEPPLANATLELWRERQKLDDYITSDTGYYSFTGLQPGSYTVIETNPPGYHSTTPDVRTVTVQAGDARSIDFGDRIGSAAYSIFKPLMSRSRRVTDPTPTPTVTSTPTSMPPRWYAGTGLPNKQVNALLRFNSTCEKTYAGLDDLGVYRTVDGGGSWNRQGLDSSVLSLASVPWNDNNVYGATWGLGVMHSTNGGADWTAMNSGLEGNQYLYAIVLDATQDTLYAGTGSAGVYKSTNGGNSWQGVNTGLTDSNVRALAIDPQAGQSVVYAGTVSGIFKSTNGGGNWQKIGPADVRIRGITIDPLNRNIIYLATDNGVYRSPDGGNTWPGNTHKIVGQRVNVVAIDALASNTAYAGREDHGVYRTTNGGFSWQAMNTGLPAGISVRSLATTGGAFSCPRIYAGTRENMVWVWR